MDTEKVKENVQKPYIWNRFFYMVILLIAFNLAKLILYSTMILQFASRLISTKKLDKLDPLAIELSHYLKNVMLYLTFNSEQKPFPFADWQESNK